MQAAYYGALAARLSSLVERASAEIKTDVRCDNTPDGLECRPALASPTDATVAELLTVLTAAHAVGIVARPFYVLTPLGTRIEIYW